MGYQLLTTTGAADPAAGGNLLTTGEETFSRMTRIDSSNLVSGRIWLTYFTARKSETTTQVRVLSGSTATVTPTLVRLGLWSIAADGTGTLVAATTSDTTVLSAVTTAYTRSWVVPYAKTAGTRLAFGVLVVAATAGSVQGITVPSSNVGPEMVIAPRLTGNLSGQADLPSSFADASLGFVAAPVYAAVLP